ncbi:hypothetical protein [Flavobacterium sp.]|jgi:hypothetical protein|uniref:hypothetical protein n=1 Tax=Flavobacterium sp. TaxID=239 RepID=UPI0037C08566
MNERIRELAKIKVWHAGGGIVSDTAVDVIAELIVRECASFVDSQTSDCGGTADSWCDGEMLLEEFGVE